MALSSISLSSEPLSPDSLDDQAALGSNTNKLSSSKRKVVAKRNDAPRKKIKTSKEPHLSDSSKESINARDDDVIFVRHIQKVDPAGHATKSQPKALARKAQPVKLTSGLAALKPAVVTKAGKKSGIKLRLAKNQGRTSEVKDRGTANDPLSAGKNAENESTNKNASSKKDDTQPGDTSTAAFDTPVKAKNGKVLAASGSVTNTDVAKDVGNGQVDAQAGCIGSAPFSTFETELAKLKSEFGEKDGKIAELEAKLEAKDGRIAELETQLKTKESTIEGFEKISKEKDIKITFLENEMTAKDDVITTKDKKIADQEQLIDAMKEQYQAEVEDHEGLKAEHEELKDGIFGLALRAGGGEVDDEAGDEDESVQ